MPSESHPTDDEKRLSPQLGLLTVGLLTTAVGQSFIFAILPPLGREVDLSVIQINTIIASSALVFSAASCLGSHLRPSGAKTGDCGRVDGLCPGNFLFALIFDSAMRGWLSGSVWLDLVGRCSQAVVMSAATQGSGLRRRFQRPEIPRALARLGTASSR